MAITISCKGDYVDAFTCCAGGTNQQIRKGLLVDDSGAGTFIDSPFFVFEGSSGVMVSDNHGNRKEIPLASTSYGSVRELARETTKCQTPTFIQKFTKPIGTTLTITVNGGNLPANKDQIWIEVENGQTIHPDDFSVTHNAGGNDVITFTYDQPDVWDMFVKFWF